MTNSQSKKSALYGMYAGLALTIITILILYLDRATTNILARHIQAGYPSYSQSRIDEAVKLWMIYWTILGILGVVSWLFAIWCVKKDKKWARWVATGLFALGTSIALFNLLVKDNNGETGLPPVLGLIGLLPSLAGLWSVIQLWKKS